MKGQLEKSQRERCGKTWTEIKKLAPNREESTKFVGGR